MLWIVQNDLYNERGYARLLETLERHEIPHTAVKIVPFLDKLLPADCDSFALNSQDPLPEITVAADQPIFVCGAHTLCRIAKQRGWSPGSFLNENFDFAVWRQHYDCLNEAATVCRFDQVDPSDEPFFIRPCDDGKAFAGTVFDRDGFRRWQSEVLNLKNEQGLLNAATMVVVAPYQRIAREYRFFVIAEKIVTASLYKIGERVIYSEDVDADLFDYVRSAIAGWQPARAFVIDIALMVDGSKKVIEINTINSAGFYACDVQKIVFAIEDL